jgi:hypothetical protein
MHPFYRRLQKPSANCSPATASCYRMFVSTSARKRDADFCCSLWVAQSGVGEWQLQTMKIIIPDEAKAAL